MNSMWLNEYPLGVPHEINPDNTASVFSVFEKSVEKFADLPAFVNFGTTLSYAELDSLSRNFAAYLQNELGIRKGDRVAIMLPNLLQYPVALFGVMRAGAVVVNVNPLYTPRELEHQLNDSGAKAIVVFTDSTPTLAEVIGKTGVETVIVTRLDDLLSASKPSTDPDPRLVDTIDFKAALETGKQRPLAPVPLTGDDMIFLQYTGGTTGLSKGAVLTHRNVVANLEQCSAFVVPVLEEGKEIIITALPLYHIFALTVNCLMFMRLGGTNVLITNPRDMQSFVEELGKWQFTAITAVNTLFNGLLHTPGFAELDLSALKFSMGGGMAVQRAVAEQWQRVTGCPVLQAYGLSETSPALTINPVNLTAFNESIGIPIPSTTISLRDEAGNEVPIGEPGELCAKGPQVMQGYWNRPEATAEVMTDDGFFRTGDIATVDERGYFRIVDRKKDMILVSGFNVFPNEVEDVIAHCPGVLENACVGVPDPRSGEAVKVFVVKKPGVNVTVDEVLAHCKQNLTAYKVPKQVEFIDELPKTNVGKILRRQLRDIALPKAA